MITRDQHPAHNSGIPGDFGDRELAWLRQQMPDAPASTTLNDLWLMYLGEQGYTGTLDDRLYEYFQNLTL